MYAKFYPVIAHETLLHSRRDIGHVAVGQVTLHYRGKVREPIFKKDMIGRCGPVRIVYFFILKHNSGPTETVSGPDFCRACGVRKGTKTFHDYAYLPCRLIGNTLKCTHARTHHSPQNRFTNTHACTQMQRQRQSKTMPQHARNCLLSHHWVLFLVLFISMSMNFCGGACAQRHT